MRYRTPGAIRARRFYRKHKVQKDPLDCGWCKKPFTPRRSTAKYCCDVCRSHHWQNEQFIKWNLQAEWNRYFPCNHNDQDRLMYMRARLIELRANNWEFIHPAHVLEEIRLANNDIPSRLNLV